MQYAAALAAFSNFLREKGWPPLNIMAFTLSYLFSLSLLLSEFVQDYFDAGEPMYKAQKLVDAMVAYYPHLRPHGVYEVARRSMKTWLKVEPVEHSEIFDEKMALSFIVIAFCNLGYEKALYFWMMFHCIMRPSEPLGLNLNNISVPLITDPNQTGVVAVTDPKTRHVSAREQSILVTDPYLLRWLRYLKYNKTCLGHTKLFSFDYDGARSAFMTVQRLAGFNLPPFTLRSWRGTGATAHFRKYKIIGRTRDRGRWENERSLRHYLHEALARQVSILLSPNVLALRDDMLQFARSILSHPPSVPAPPVHRTPFVSPASPARQPPRGGYRVVVKKRRS